MIIGQAAGIAASLAIAENVALQEIDVKALRSKLERQRAVIDWKQQNS